mmetsp:Transcript_46074/g.112236  ORF Transcript_46074/g.112236 Transcript_46074/m.112236 type:complete len:291 (-) Transcript_46074:283-1155(-)
MLRSVDRDVGLDNGFSLFGPRQWRVTHDALDVQLLEGLEGLRGGEGVEAGHVGVFQSEVEDPSVLDHALPLHRLGDVDDALLHAPAPEDLRSRLAVLPGKLHNEGVCESLSITQGTVRLDRDALLLEKVDGVLAVKKGVHLDLVDRRLDGSLLHQLLVVLNSVVAHADTLDLPLSLELLQRLVRLHVLGGHGPMHEIQIQIVCLQVCECAEHLRTHCLLALIDLVRPYLGGQVQLLARDAAVLDGKSNLSLVAVELSTVQEPVAHLKRLLHALSRGLLGAACGLGACCCG